MAKRAFVLGGTGQIGRAAARRLLSCGWDVVIAGRHAERVPDDIAEDVRFERVDRSQPGELERALGDGVDLLVDVISMDAADARQLRALAPRLGTLVAVSSASVYADARASSLDEAQYEETFPQLPVPIPETQPTVEPGEGSYSAEKVAMERTLLEQDEVPATVVRPCAVHGPAAPVPRELFFVKRALDSRSFVLLVDRGENVFHTTSVENLAELIRLAAERPATRVLNCGDPDPPSVLRIARAVAAVLDAEWVECLLPRTPWYRGAMHANPWPTPRPFVVDMTAATRELDYTPVVTYDEAVVATCRWLVDERVEPSEYMSRFFDYAAEDAFVRGLAA